MKPPSHAVPISLVFIDAQGAQQHAKAASGQSLMKAAVGAGVAGVAADCGGTLSCATCHVLLAPDWLARLPPPSSDEQAMLELTASPRQPGSRLSCQIVLDESLDGMPVQLPPNQY
jgi:ferredoxin, 2Fe-2S